MKHPLLAFLILALAGPAAAAGFSVYLAPPAEGGAALSVRDDLHIDVAGKALPLRLKEARQSIEYPLPAGGTLAFFRVTRQGDREQRETLASTSVPAGAATGVMVLAPQAGKLVLTPLWWNTGDLEKGHAVFVNLTGRELGVACAGQRVRLLAGKRWSIAPAAAAAGELTPQRVELFGREGDAYTRILDQSVAIPKSDTALCLIVPKQGKYATILALEAGGARDETRQEALRKQLPPP